MIPSFIFPDSGDLPRIDMSILRRHHPPCSTDFVPPPLLIAAGWLAEGYIKGLGTDIYNRLHGRDIATVIQEAVAENAKTIKQAFLEHELRQAVAKIRDLETLIVSYNNAKATSLDRLEHATILSNSLVSELEQMGTQAFSSFTVAVQLQLSVLQERHIRLGEPGELSNQEVTIGRWHKRAGEELGRADDFSKINPVAFIAIPSCRNNIGAWVPGVFSVCSSLVPRVDHIKYTKSFNADKKAAEARNRVIGEHREAFYEAYYRLLLGDIHVRFAEMIQASLLLSARRHQ